MGELVQPGGVSENCLEVCFVVLVVGGSYLWCLVIIVIFMVFGGAKRGEDALKSSFGVAMQATKERGQFLWWGPHYVILLY